MDRMQRFENLLSVALADGRLTEREMRLLSERAREWRLDDHQFTVAVNHCLERPGHLRIPEERSERAELLRDALSVMASDGQLMDAEKRLFAFIAARMDFSAAEIDAIIMELVGRSSGANAKPPGDSSVAAKPPAGRVAKGGKKDASQSATSGRSAAKKSVVGKTSQDAAAKSKKPAKSTKLAKSAKPTAKSPSSVKISGKPASKSATKSEAKSAGKSAAKAAAKAAPKSASKSIATSAAKASKSDSAKVWTQSTKSSAKNPRAGGKKASRRAHGMGLTRRAPR